MNHQETAMNSRRQIALASIAVVTTALSVVLASHAIADAGCWPGGGGPPRGAVSKDVSDVYGQPATLWLTAYKVGISTPEGFSEAEIHSPSPLQRTALMVDAQQDGSHQVIVDTGRDAPIFTVSGCTIAPVVTEDGVPFYFDIGHRRDIGDGIGCSDLGDGRRLVQLLRHPDTTTVSRTEIDLNGAWATIGRSDTVTATSDQDPVWTTAGMISCGDLTITKDGLQAHW
jgi:hypothetical protein